jgi:hypothetical protein
MQRTLSFLATAAAFALAAPAAHADSAASASLSFNVVAGPGFAWVNEPDFVSFGESTASAVDFAGWIPSAGVFSPNFGAGGSSASGTVPGTAVPISSASVGGADTFASSFTFTDAGSRVGALSATAVVPTGGVAQSLSFARSFFTLAPGASVTFAGALSLFASGTNAAWPANYDLSSFYGHAGGLMAIAGGSELSFEIGGPATGAPGSYALSSIQPLALTVTNTGGAMAHYALETGVAVYSASVVPEPGTAALWLAGLAWVAFVAGRRRG